jgi:HAE1 family hydrophobic/amphiphilic exporter-1
MTLLRVVPPLALGTLGLLAAARPLAGEPISRAEAVRLALSANPDVKKADENLNRLMGLVTETRADALPELTVYGTWARFRDPSLLNSPSFDNFPPEFIEQLRPVPATIWDGYATLKQTLWSFRVGRAIKAAKLARRSGDEEIRRVHQVVSLLAVQAYNEYVLSRERVRVAGSAVKQKEIQLETTRNRRAAGVATELDVLRFEVDLENARAQLLAQEGGAELARGRLNAVLVRPIGAPIEPTDGLDYVPMNVDPDVAVTEAWSRRPEVKQVELEERIRDHAVAIARADALPSLEFNGSFGWSVRQTTNFFEGDFQRWTTGITLTIPVFDGLRTAGKVAQARAERNTVTQTRIDLENQIRLEARDAVDRLIVAMKVLDTTELNVAQSRKALEMIQANYKFGAATLLDVIDAQAAQTLADSNRVQALYTHANARAMLRFVMAQDPLDPTPGAPATPPDPTVPPASPDPGTRP